MKVLVTGATGYIGGRLIPRLLDAGHSVRVLARDPRKVHRRPWSEAVEIVRGDLTDRDSLTPALDGIDVAYYLVHSMGSAKDYAERDRTAAGNFVAAGRNLTRAIYLGGLVPESGGGMSEHLASRAEVGEILRDGLPTVEFRAGPIIGSGSASFEMVRYLTERLPAMIAPKWIKNPVQPIAVRDVLSYLVAALNRPGVDGGPEGVVEIGTEPLTFKAMMQGYAAVRGLRRWIVPVPVLAPGLAARWVGFVTPISNDLAVPLVKGVVRPLIGDLSRALELFPEIEPMSYRAAVEGAVEDTLEGQVVTRWSSTWGIGSQVEFQDREGIVREVRTRQVNASPKQVFRAFSSLGGDKGWLVWNWAWRARGLLDQLIGGPGLRRGRRHTTELLPGEAVDFWRVEEVAIPSLLRLRAEMKVPGKAWLQWETQPNGAGTRLVQTAFFAPVGLPGFLYWYGIYPLHGWIFSDMVKAIAEEAEAMATADSQ
ncbi:MAG: DUF2867 domain-containing protein [Acidobacteriota bacterium]